MEWGNFGGMFFELVGEFNCLVLKVDNLLWCDFVDELFFLNLVVELFIKGVGEFVYGLVNFGEFYVVVVVWIVILFFEESESIDIYI